MSNFVFFHIVLVIVFVIAMLGIVYNMLHINSIIGGLYIHSRSINKEQSKLLVKDYQLTLYKLFAAFIIATISLFLIFSH